MIQGCYIMVRCCRYCWIRFVRSKISLPVSYPFFITEAALTYMRNKEHDEALQLLRTIILKERGSSKVVSLLQMIRCQIEMGQTQSAIAVCDEVAEILDTKLGELHIQLKAKSHEELKTVVALFTQIEKMDAALLVLQTQFILVQDSYKDEIKLHKLKELGHSMTKITKKLFSQEKASYKAKDCCKFLDNILREMQKLMHIDLEVKTRVIVNFVIHYSSCCIDLHKYAQSMELMKQAIFCMNSMFGDYATSYQSLGHCYLHLALALEHTIKFDKAKDACDKAIDTYKQANDWDDVQGKKRCTSLATSIKDRVELRQASYNLFWAADVSLSEEDARKLKHFLPLTTKRLKFPIASPFFENRSKLREQLQRANSIEF